MRQGSSGAAEQRPARVGWQLPHPAAACAPNKQSPACQVLRELAADAGLDRFRAEYEKVFRALQRAHNGEQRLVARCRELNAEIVAGAAKVQAALKLSDEDQVGAAGSGKGRAGRRRNARGCVRQQPERLRMTALRRDWPNSSSPLHTLRPPSRR